MGNQKKAHKRDDKKTKRSSSSDLSKVFWAAVAAIAALVALLVQQKLFAAPKIPDSYATSSPETVVVPDHITDPRIFEAISVYVEPESHADKNIRQLPADMRRWPPGERGVGIRLDDKKMSPEEKVKREEMYKKHAFEEYVSELISYNRSLPDWRGDWCRNSYPSDRSDLDPTSIVICFHNEAWSTLVRTVHSIVNRSPDHLLEEILLIDDKSDMEHLGRKLDDYMAAFPKVRVVRAPERLGLIRCRMFGSTEAKGKTLTFLDSHIEAGIGWLEPLLYRVKEEPKLIISPVIDAINDTTFWYTFIERDLKGLLNWNMRFEWQEISSDEQKRKPNVWAPHVNPVMSGGLFTINKDWFEHIGYYDTGMEIWGGENFEVSFKAWMCGGRIEIAPCSRVGHVFRTWSPYKVDTKKNVAYNNIRVAQVWMDEFKYLYFDRLGHYDLPLNERLSAYGDVSSRKELREKLGCKTFKWYLDKVVHKALPYHTLIGAGEIRNDHMGFCLDQNDMIDMMNQPVYAIPCHGDAGNQYWWLNSNFFLMRDYLCVGVLPDGLTVSVMNCAEVKPWKVDKAKKRLMYDGKCLAVGAANNIYTAHVLPCQEGNPMQEWVFSKFNLKGLAYEDLGNERLNRV